MSTCRDRRHTTRGDTHMADPPRYPDTGDDTGEGPDPESTTGTRRWVKVLVVIAIVLLLALLVFLHLGGGLRGLH